MHKGSCLCGAVTFEVEGELSAPDACHCSKCRKHSGHYFASTDVPKDRLTVHGAENVRWYQSSEKVRRGFCATCGSSLFWDPPQRDWIAVAMGAFGYGDEDAVAHAYLRGRQGRLLRHHRRIAAERSMMAAFCRGIPGPPASPGVRARLCNFTIAFLSSPEHKQGDDDV